MTDHTCHADCPCQTGADPPTDFEDSPDPNVCQRCHKRFVSGDKCVDIGDEKQIVMAHAPRCPK